MKKFNILVHAQRGAIVREIEAANMQEVISELHRGALQLFGQNIEVQGLKFDGDKLVDITFFQRNRYGILILSEITITQLN